MRHIPMIALALTSVLAFAELVEASPALAEPHCATLEHLKTQFGKKTHFAILTPGQLNFALGGYIATPPVNGKFPNGDHAILATHEGDEGGVILWMRGSLVCEPTPVPEAFVRAMKHMKTGPVDDDGNEI
jgi:hypothetical protein